VMVGTVPIVAATGRRPGQTDRLCGRHFGAMTYRRRGPTVCWPSGLAG